MSAQLAHYENGSRMLSAAHSPAFSVLYLSLETTKSHGSEPRTDLTWPSSRSSGGAGATSPYSSATTSASAPPHPGGVLLSVAVPHLRLSYIVSPAATLADSKSPTALRERSFPHTRPVRRSPMRSGRAESPTTASPPLIPTSASPRSCPNEVMS